MITTTFQLLKEASACRSSYQRFAKHVGGRRKYGVNKPIPLTVIADVCGIQDALWCLRCTQQPDETKRLARLLAADFAEHVLPIFERQYPNDDRPRKAIKAARLFAEGKIGAAARAAAWAAAGDAAKAAAKATAAAWAAAGDAAWAAAWAAAGDAAGAAVWAAEQEWQLTKFKEALST